MGSTKTREGQVWGKVNLATNSGGGETAAFPLKKVPTFDPNC